MSAVPLTNSEPGLYSLYKTGNEETDDGVKGYSERGYTDFSESRSGFYAVRILVLYLSVDRLAVLCSPSNHSSATHRYEEKPNDDARVVEQLLHRPGSRF